jgi:hypothetical protein
MVEKVIIRLAWLVPRRLAYWCAIRVGAHATTGKWAAEETPALLFCDALQRWDA